MSLVPKLVWGFSQAIRLRHINNVFYSILFCVQLLFSRYPTFIDAVRDLDDALSMLVLFSMMPQTDKIQVYIGVNFLLQNYVCFQLW